MPDIVKILVIEQKPTISKQLKQTLNRRRNIVFMVDTVSEAIERLKFVYFDILIVDVQSDWNDQKDYQLLRSIRWMSPQIQIVLLIDEEKVKQINNLEGLELSDIIPKPWKNQDLITSVSQLIECSMTCFSRTVI